MMRSVSITVLSVLSLITTQATLAQEALDGEDFAEESALSDDIIDPNAPQPSSHGASYGLIPGLDFAGGVGTKFVCCRAENVSTISGGGATVFTPMLRDRALTPVDARLRCGIYSMYWNTHSCPDDTNGSSGSTVSRPRDTSLQFCNHSPKKLMVSYAYFIGGNKGWGTRGWYPVKAESCMTVNIGRYRQNRVFVFASSTDRKHTWSGGEYSFCVHKRNKFHYNKADSSNCTGNLAKPSFLEVSNLTPGRTNRLNFNWN